MEVNQELIDIERDNFLSALNPFASLDIERALGIAVEVDKGGEWVANVVNNYTEELGITLTGVDVVDCVYEAILQEARTEIDDLTDFDFCNDGADIYVAGNYTATTYDWGEGDNIKIKDKLIEKGIVFDELSVKTRWFLTEIEANY